MLFDSPPLLPVTDAAVVAARVDGVVTVVTAGRTRRALLHRAMATLVEMHTPLLGEVLNMVDAPGGRLYDAAYTYGYHTRSYRLRETART